MTEAQLTTVALVHRLECTFGPGAYRLRFGERQERYCQSWADVQTACALLKGAVPEISVDRDGFCLDGMEIGDANTPDVIDAEWWLGLNVADGMRELGLTREADYTRVYKDLEAAVGRRNDRASQGGVRASIVIKRPGAQVTDA